MKRLVHYIITLFLVSLFSACERDFDELLDTNQRSITLRFDLPSFRFERLEQTQEGTFILKDDPVLADGQAIRLSVFFYDDANNLVHKSLLLSSRLETKDIIVRHLSKDIHYNILCIADIVTIDPYVDYYENWYQMAYNRPDTFYLTSHSRSGDGISDIILIQSIAATPNNQVITATMEQITYNGYFVFDNTEKVDKLYGSIGTLLNIYVRNDINTNDYYFLNTFEETSIKGNRYIKSATFNYLDTRPFVSFKVNALNKIDSTKVYFPNEKLRPFIATLDCKSMTSTSIIFY